MTTSVSPLTTTLPRMSPVSGAALPSPSGLVIRPPSPTGLTPMSTASMGVPVSNTPLADVVRTGLVSPDSTIKLSPLSAPSQTVVYPPLSTNNFVSIPPSPRSVAQNGLSALRPISVTPPSSITQGAPVVDVSPPLRPVSPAAAASIRSATARPTSVVVPPTMTRTTSVIRPPSVIRPMTPSAGISPGPLAEIAGFGPSGVTSSIRRTPSVRVEETVSLDEEIVPAKTIEGSLTEKGYVIKDKIFVNTPSGTVPKYVKVASSLGDTAFVNLDKHGTVVYDTGDRTMIVSQEATMVPTSKQIGAFKCAEMGGTCGSVLECKNGICSVTRSVDDPTRPTTVNLQEVIPPQDGSAIVVEGVPTAYPLVNLSDILTNPEATAQAIRKSEMAIRNANRAESVRDWQALREQFNKFRDALNRFYFNSDRAYYTLDTDLKELDQYREAYIRRGSLPAEEQRKFERTAKNIDYRQQELIQLFGLLEQVQVLTETLKRETEKLNQSNEVLEEKYDFTPPRYRLRRTLA